MTKITGFILILITNIGLMLILTMIIAALTLIERRILALVQRRVGPTFVGYKGRLQYIADALKLFTKAAFIPDEANRIWFITIPSIVAALCYSLWMNSVWAPSLSLFEIEYNLVYVSLFSILFSFCVMLTGYFSHNKYAMIASIRCAVITLNLELFMGLLVLNITLLTRSFSFLPAVVLQESVWLIFTFLGISGLIIITFLLETNRTPFDLAEAESELVAGYTVEYGGFFFGLFYLGEYLHLFFGSAVIAVLFLGGWELPTFLWFIFNDLYIFSSYWEDLYAVFEEAAEDLPEGIRVFWPEFQRITIIYLRETFLIITLIVQRILVGIFHLPQCYANIIITTLSDCLYIIETLITLGPIKGWKHLQETIFLDMSQYQYTEEEWEKHMKEHPTEFPPLKPGHEEAYFKKYRRKMFPDQDENYPAKGEDYPKKDEN